MRPARTDDVGDIVALLAASGDPSLGWRFGARRDAALRFLVARDLVHDPGRRIVAVAPDGNVLGALAIVTGGPVATSPQAALSGAIGRIGSARARLVGRVVGAPAIPTDGAYIVELIVDADRRRSGVARALLAASFDIARAAGRRRLVLVVDAGNVGALTLYRRFGFREYAQPIRRPLPLVGARHYLRLAAPVDDAGATVRPNR